VQFLFGRFFLVDHWKIEKNQAIVVGRNFAVLRMFQANCSED
jgi:hypothetical protein